ncbi:acyl-CoA thioesterase [Burkholderia ubonensis]|uniref:acyl-CoA thioesterase n=1 Tax=Burkholderia ubonensis TaxID=101571 RepID=UPI0005DA0A40|nr:thioesterase family protein [Burkholderia ubonensis]AJX14729.1 acyl-CoA thioester hydrolase, YbgC/YbaW family protein [Burkholderia ubonensis MSMB22]KVP02717.1 thioesterase [Burkholderia ubonensis]KWO80740.1 thioesterase [Burkholderia ubonensis]
MRTDEDDTTLDYEVGYADTDAGGIVYHARYIEMAERARNRLMRAAGYSFARLADDGALFIVRRVEAVYHASAWLEDRLTLRARIASVSVSRSVWVTDVARDGAPIAQVTIEMVAVDRATRRAVPHPAALIDCLAPYAAQRAGAPA